MQPHFNPEYNPHQLWVLEQTLFEAIQSHTRLVAVRVDLRYPNDPEDIYSYFDGMHTDSDISRFVASLKAKVRVDVARKSMQWGRRLQCDLRYIWVREHGPNSHKPHFHLMLFLNKDIYASLGGFGVAHGTLASLVRSAWCSVLGLPYLQYQNLVSFPRRPLIFVDRRSPHFAQQCEMVMQRGSYLCKYFSKQAEAGRRAFGASRLSSRTRPDGGAL